MKKLVLVFSLCLGMFSFIKGQDQNNPNSNGPKQGRTLSIEERAKNNSNKAEKELALTADQKQKWEAASLERIKQNEPLKQKMQGSTTPEERKNLRQQMRANNQKFEQNVMTFLSAEQKTKFEAMKKAHRGKGKGHAHGQHQHQGDAAPAPNEINKN